MNSNICIYEDQTTENFGPLIYTRPVWELRCGAFTFSDKIMQQIGDTDIAFRCRYNIKNHYVEKTNWKWLELAEVTKDTLFINGRAIFSAHAIQKMTNSSEETIFTSDNNIAAFRIDPLNITGLKWDDSGSLNPKSLDVKNHIGIEAKLISYPWQLIQTASIEIENDLKSHANTSTPRNSNSIPDDVIIRNGDEISIHSDVTIGAGSVLSAENYSIRLDRNSKLGSGVILDSSNGSIWIAENAEIQAGAIIMGPAYIGPHSIVRPGAKISDGVSLGPHCRVGGEVSASTMIAYSNKQHSGYLGNAYLGEWINLGAATDNSDLKNNYKPVDVLIDGNNIDSGSLHVGVFLADFTRTAIHTRLNSGTMIGVGCNIFGNDFPDKSIPSFVWHGNSGYQDYLIDKAIETISVVMSRRNQELTAEHEKLLRQIYSQSQIDRDMLSNK